MVAARADRPVASRRDPDSQAAEPSAPVQQRVYGERRVDRLAGRCVRIDLRLIGDNGGVLEARVAT